MFNSIEMRQPFIDIELIKFLINQPIKFLYNKKINKPLLRNLLTIYWEKSQTQVKREREIILNIYNKNF